MTDNQPAVLYPLAHDEIWAMAELEKLRDKLRFRVDGLRPDLLQERPEGFTLTMVDVISALHAGEKAFNAALREIVQHDNPTLSTRFAGKPTAYVSVPFEEVGALLNLREQTLVLLRRLGSEQWNRTVTDPQLGQRTLRDVVVEWANSEIDTLEQLKTMRYTLMQSIRPATRTISGKLMPDPTR